MADSSRMLLAQTLRSSLDILIARVTGEAVRVAPDVPRESVARLIAERSSLALDAVAADDRTRAAALARVVMHDAETQLVPPVARLGLIEISLQFAREELLRATLFHPQRVALEQEFERFATALRRAVVVSTNDDLARARAS